MSADRADRPGAGPRVSVIVPCYRQGRYLGEAIESVRAQSHANWECIVVDDGSPDDSRQVALSFTARDSRVRYVGQPNLGAAAARNRALAESTGAYLQFLDADDLLLPDKLAEAVDAARTESRPAVVIHDFWLMDATGHRYASEICTPEFVLDDPLHDMTLRWETELTVAINAMLFDARLFRDPELRFDETLANHEDWECWMRVLARRPALVRVREKSAVYRVHAASMSRDEERSWRGFREAIDRQLGLNANDATLRRMLAYKRRMTDDFYGKGWRAGLVARLRRPGRLSNALPPRARRWLLEWLDLTDLRAHGWRS